MLNHINDYDFEYDDNRNGGGGKQQQQHRNHISQMKHFRT